MIIMETKRLLLRKMNEGDWDALCAILQDEETMYAYEGAFDDTQVREWLDRQYDRYTHYGYGLWAVVLKSSGEMIGQCGLTWQTYKEKQVLEIGYLFQKAYWHKGYAIEAAAACKEYAFKSLNEPIVYSIIRDTNVASKNVAKRNGMVWVDQFTKFYRGVYMPHDVYCTKKKQKVIR